MSGAYGGDYSALTDFNKVIADGDLNYGLQIDPRYNGGDFTTMIQIKTGTGNTFAQRVLIPITAMVFDNAGSEVVATTPIAGVIGETGNTVLGDNAHFRTRYAASASESLLGRRQFDVFFSFNFT
jgi:hypothetical protein